MGPDEPVAQDEAQRGGVRGVFIGIGVSAGLVALSYLGLSSYNDDGNNPWWVGASWLLLLAGVAGLVISLVALLIYAFSVVTAWVSARRSAGG
jgi:hypothetical protein